MFLAMAASIVLVVATILMLYETFRLTSNHLTELPVPPRARIIVVVLAAFVGHTAAVWTYAFAYGFLRCVGNLEVFLAYRSTDFSTVSISRSSPIPPADLVTRFPSRMRG
jgi:hypothetical protein